MKVGGGLPKARARGIISRVRAEELVSEYEDVCIWMFVERIGCWLADGLYGKNGVPDVRVSQACVVKSKACLSGTPRFGS